MARCLMTPCISRIQAERSACLNFTSIGFDDHLAAQVPQAGPCSRSVVCPVSLLRVNNAALQASPPRSAAGAGCDSQQRRCCCSLGRPILRVSCIGLATSIRRGHLAQPAELNAKPLPVSVFWLPADGQLPDSDDSTAAHGDETHNHSSCTHPCPGQPSCHIAAVEDDNHKSSSGWPHYLRIITQMKPLASALSCAVLTTCSAAAHACGALHTWRAGRGGGRVLGRRGRRPAGRAAGEGTRAAGRRVGAQRVGRVVRDVHLHACTQRHRGSAGTDTNGCTPNAASGIRTSRG